MLPFLAHALDQLAHHARPHHYPHQADSTAYSPCSSGTITASGQPTRWGYVAQNTLPLGTWIELRHAILGSRRFRVMDRIGWGSSLDVWMPSCAAATSYGRRVVHSRVLGGRP